MGCTSSKPARRHRRLGSSRSMPAGHHAEQRVTLKSCTLGSLKLDHEAAAASDEQMKKAANDRLKLPPRPETKPKQRTVICRTPTMTPDNEPETINAWELMAGLEDTPPLRSLIEQRSFSFSVPGSIPDDFDPEVVSSFRKTMVELSPQHRDLLRSPEPEKMVLSRYMDDDSCRKTPDLTGIVRARIIEFQERIDKRNTSTTTTQQPFKSWLGGVAAGEERVVVYFTSLRGIRDTYDKCSEVRAILRCYGVKMDERDVSMQREFNEELNQKLGFEYGARRLPAVFVKGKHLGGVEEVRRMHETGELEEAVAACKTVAAGKGGGDACGECSDIRFVVCGVCSGSCKMLVEEEDDDFADVEGSRGRGGGGRGFWCRCPECNENGLVRCPVCC